jgi:hypothetical protein
LNFRGWDLWVAVSGLMGSVDAVWLYVFVMDFLNSLERTHKEALGKGVCHRLR